MKTSTKRYAAAGGSVAAISLVVAGVAAFAGTIANAPAAPSPSPSETAYVVTLTDDELATSSTIAEDAKAVSDARIAAEAKAAAEAAAAKKAAAEQAARDAAARQQAQRQTQQSNDGGGDAPADPPAQAAVHCPAGSTATANDGTNDTACMPNVCFTIAVPDPAHPECNTAFRP